MKSYGLLVVLGASLAAALSDKEKTALVSFMKKYHPSDHTPDLLVAELSSYAADAGLSDITTKFSQKQYAQAAKQLTVHLNSIQSDPLVQPGNKLADSYRMLAGCTSELASNYH
ncbi:hypothetical protein GGI25_006115 [Coemansia spiralis]|uniref:Uncharacterized protein n=2 Tax=Coemansia TaxID=4863 RepID=A0A9W8G124_9FUNG|nr:hypothetical protein EDC05_006069 [Coemansia umbellata]KAJ2618999.1 hypothetical protein GGI26_006188 [Coemansia sp. RSA 1358]KAJ2669537.1 hypothetical protein GGI25_006115 [Coemansia spiralis]